MVPPRPPGHLTIITTMWGEDATESISVIRLVAGALARHFRVDIIHLDPLASIADTRRDSVFDVYRFPVVLPDRQQETLLRIALGLDSPDVELPDHLASVIDDRSVIDGDICACVDELAPQVILLIGCAHPYDLGRLRGAERRIIFMPLGERVALTKDRTVKAAMEIADLVIASDPGELRRFEQTFPERVDAIVPL